MFKISFKKIPIAKLKTGPEKQLNVANSCLPILDREPFAKKSKEEFPKDIKVPDKTAGLISRANDKKTIMSNIILLVNFSQVKLASIVKVLCRIEFSFFY